MASNSFGTILRITTFGESHGISMGVVIDGCPAGIDLTEKDVQTELNLRAPGRNEFVSPRKETDQAKIISGVFEGKTTGAPIAILIENCNSDSSKYETIKNIYRPGHANYSYLQKYGIYDYRGGGRASARETVCRVAAGVVAKKILDYHQIQTIAYIKSIGNIIANINTDEVINQKTEVLKDPLFCPDRAISQEMQHLITQLREAGDSVGGMVEFIIARAATGLGEPVYEKLNARLAYAMMSIPAVVGFEMGQSFCASCMKGSQYNDSFELDHEQIKLTSNHSGGILAGISTGMPIIGRVAFKPTSSIAQPQSSVDFQKRSETRFQLPKGSKHDICVAIRAVPVVEAICRLVIADALLLSRSTRL